MTFAHVGEAELEAMRSRIYRWAYRILRNHDDALDATQNVLLRALAAGPAGLAGIERPLAWLRRVTVRHCIDLLRARRPAAGGLDGLAGAADSAESSERGRRIAAALGALTPHQRAVLTAKTYDRETFEEIAASLGMATSTAKTHYLRALRRLRDLLGPKESNLP